MVCWYMATSGRTPFCKVTNIYSALQELIPSEMKTKGKDKIHIPQFTTPLSNAAVPDDLQQARNTNSIHFPRKLIHYIPNKYLLRAFT